MPRGRQLSLEQLTAARRGYEAGATFQALADQHGIADRSEHPTHGALGVEPRPRMAPKPVPVADLIIADYHAGLSAREIATKHGLPTHQRVTRLLRDHGVEIRPGHGRRKLPGVVLGSSVTDFQARLGRRPPLKIPPRTAAERPVRTWTPAEIGAIEYELAAGRFAVIARGVSGRREDGSPWRAGTTFAFYIALQRVRAAA